MTGKPWTSTSQQIEILVNRGLSDAPDFERYLTQIGYYRLSGYSYPLRQFVAGDQTQSAKQDETGSRRLDSFVPGSRMSHVIALYEFDEQLRLALWQAFCKLEIALRFDVGHIFGHADPYLHLHLSRLWKSGNKRERAEKFSKKLAETQQRSSEEFVKHHQNLYQNRMPIWVVTEILEFGSLVNLYSLGLFEQRKQMADLYEARTDELESWLRVMNYLRNICAHHARLWNRQLVIRPSTKYRVKDKMLGLCLERSDRIFAGLSLMAYLLECKGLTKEIGAISYALTNFPHDVPQCSITDTGAPPDWQNLALWSQYCG